MKALGVKFQGGGRQSPWSTPLDPPLHKKLKKACNIHINVQQIYNKTYNINMKYVTKAKRHIT